MAVDTSSLGGAGLALQFGGVFSSAIGGFYAAKSSKLNLETQAYLADKNAQIAELSAESALYQGQQQVGQMTLHAGHVKSAQRAAMAANGIDLGEGSAAEVQASTDTIKEIDKNTIEANAARSAFGYRTQAMNFENQATMQRATASGINPTAAAASSLLAGAGQVASSWYAFNKNIGPANSPSNGGDPIYEMGSKKGWWDK